MDIKKVFAGSFNLMKCSIKIIKNKLQKKGVPEFDQDLPQTEIECPSCHKSVIVPLQFGFKFNCPRCGRSGSIGAI